MLITDKAFNRDCFIDVQRLFLIKFNLENDLSLVQLVTIIGKKILRLVSSANSESGAMFNF